MKTNGNHIQKIDHAEIQRSTELTKKRAQQIEQAIKDENKESIAMGEEAHMAEITANELLSNAQKWGCTIAIYRNELACFMGYSKNEQIDMCLEAGNLIAPKKYQKNGLSTLTIQKTLEQHPEYKKIVITNVEAVKHVCKNIQEIFKYEKPTEEIPEETLKKVENGLPLLTGKKQDAVYTTRRI